MPGIPLLTAPLALAGAAVGLGRGVSKAIPREVAGLPRAAADLVVETFAGTPARRSSSTRLRTWVEIRGLDGPDAHRIESAALEALRALPGVHSADLNRPMARIVVTVDPHHPERPSAARLGEIVASAESDSAAAHARAWTLSFDDAAMVARTVGMAAAAAGLGVAVTGRLIRLPGLPNTVSVIPTLADHIPRLRRGIEQRLGSERTDLVFAVVNSTVAALTVAPVSAAYEVTVRTMLAAEAWDNRLAWRRRENRLAEHCADERPFVRPEPPADGSADRYANRAGGLGSLAAPLLAVLAGNPQIAGGAALVAAPKPVRSSREAFGYAVGAGLAARHNALVIRPRALRVLDRVDTVVIDPRALYTDELMVGRVRGVTNSARTRAWQAAREALADGRLARGWHPLSAVPGAGRVGDTLISPVREPYAAAVVAEARQAKRRVVSVADDGLRSLAKGFDELRPIGQSMDRALADAVDAAKRAGETVVLLTTPEMAAAHRADLTVGVLHADRRPPWGADVFVDDLTGVWRLLHALPTAREVADKAVELSWSSSALGALMLIPGVRGDGPSSVTAAAIAGMVSGYAAGRRVLRDPLPAPEPGHDWHNLPVAEVQRILPRPPDMPSDDQPAPRGLPGVAVQLGDRIRSGQQLIRDFVAEMQGNLDDPITPILFTGALASALLGSPFDALLVGGVLVTNAALSAQQQLHAERILHRLLAVQDPPARRRVGDLDDQRDEEVPAERLRPGDVIDIRSGEVVPADARLIAVGNLEVDESSLTGESLPVAKQTEPASGAPLAERACMVYAGSTAVAGSGLGVVTAVGAGSEMRRATAMAPSRAREIGLQHQLRRITGRALPWTLTGGALVGLLSMVRRTPVREAVSGAVGVVVAAVPEGLPLVATLAQLAAARRLSNESVLIRNPQSVEALARLDVVCFDKTGTLSENLLTVKSTRPVDGAGDSEVLQTAANTVPVTPGVRVEHATDDAILRAAHRAGLSPAQPDAVLPFQSGRPFAASLSGSRLSIKGAPEKVLPALAGGDGSLPELLGEMAAAGLRVLAVACRDLEPELAARAAADPQLLEQLCDSGLRPVGLLGLADTPRPAAQALLAELAHRGIGVRLVTGDHPVTAAVIAGDLGLAVIPEQVMTGEEWEMLSADDRTRAVTERLVYARMSPEHKVDVVQTLERSGKVTAMVGDGANDAAAIRAASVGVGVAARGSDPARTAADVMLLDGRIEALLDAIDEGYQLWRRVQSAVSVLLGGNAGEVCFALISSALTGRSVLNARQMLLVNMLTDALPAAALAVSPQSETGAVDRDESAMWRAIAIRGASTTSAATTAWLMGRVTGRPRRAATVALIGLVSAQMLQTLVDSHGPLVVATNIGTFAALGVIVNTPVLSQLFGCTPVGPLGWSQGFGCAVAATAVSALAPDLLAKIGRPEVLPA